MANITEMYCCINLTMDGRVMNLSTILSKNQLHIISRMKPKCYYQGAFPKSWTSQFKRKVQFNQNQVGFKKYYNKVKDNTLILHTEASTKALPSSILPLLRQLQSLHIKNFAFFSFKGERWHFTLINNNFFLL